MTLRILYFTISAYQKSFNHFFQIILHCFFEIIDVSLRDCSSFVVSDFAILDKLFAKEKLSHSDCSSSVVDDFLVIEKIIIVDSKLNDDENEYSMIFDKSSTMINFLFET